MTEFLLDVATNVVAAFVAAFIIAAGLVIWSLVIFSGVLKRARTWLRPVNPAERVFRASLRADVTWIEGTPFRNPLTEVERDNVVHFFEFLNGKSIFDGPCVRLDRIEPQVELSKVGFFDLVTTNLTAFSINMPVSGIARSLGALRRWLGVRESLHQAKRSICSPRGRPESVEDVLSNRSLANVLAVSMLLVDDDQCALIVRRSEHVAVASGEFAATASGTVSTADLEASDPIQVAAERELREETGISTPEVFSREVLIPKQKMQPVASFLGRVQGKWDEHLPTLRDAEDSYESAGFYAIDLKNPRAVANFIRSARCSDTLAAQLWAASAKAREPEWLLQHEWTRACLLNWRTDWRRYVREILVTS